MEFFTVEELSKILKVKPATIQGWVREGRLTGLRIGGNRLLRFTQNDIDRFLESTRVQEEG